MRSFPNRRDFLKLAGLLPLSLAPARSLRLLGARGALQAGQQNVLVIVFDALSAYHLSVYGYGRETMPNLTRLAPRAIVYHNHFAGGNFTTPGTASLLTGTLPWTHRALQPGGEVIERFVTRNLFSAFPAHYRIAYTHNGWANTLLEQFQAGMEELIPWKTLFLRSHDGMVQTLFDADSDTASVAWTRAVSVKQQGYSYSLFFAHLLELLRENTIRKYKQVFPRGIPSTGFAGSDFLLETAVDWIEKRLDVIPQPFLGYFHFLPPHGPYNTSLEFYNHFGQDGFAPAGKPDDVFTIHVPRNALLKRRAEYDEFLLYADQNFGRLFEYLESSGLLENTWVVFTSDHGEMFERGISGHSTDALYQPVIRVPLMIFEPGREVGMDIHEYTSAVDVLPTLAHLAGEKIPEWGEGVILPPFTSSSRIPERNIYLMRANSNDQYAPLTIASTTLVRENFKLHYYFGYSEVPSEGLVKLFDIQVDPEELTDLAAAKPETTSELLAELKVKIKQVNEPYL